MAGFTALILRSSVPLVWMPAREGLRPAPMLVRLLRNDLLERPTEFKTAIELPSAIPAELHWMGSSATAGAAAGRRGSTIQTGSLLVSGLDHDDDLGAMMCASGILGSSYALPLFQRVQQYRPPLVASLHRNEASESDPLIAIGSVSLAAAFFGLLGLTEPEP